MISALIQRRAGVGDDRDKLETEEIPTLLPLSEHLSHLIFITNHELHGATGCVNS